MKRLAIAAVGLAIAAALAFGAGAFALYVWPGKPTLPATGHYYPQEAVGRVRAVLQTEGQCTDPGQHIQWAAFVGDAKRGCWDVGELCTAKEGMLLWGTPQEVFSAAWGSDIKWEICEDDGVVIPLTDRAAEFMRPRY
jgi:hypothetical protein